MACLWSTDASAAKVCLRLDLTNESTPTSPGIGGKYDDASPVELMEPGGTSVTRDAGEDFGRNIPGDPWPLQRWLARVEALDGGALWGWRPLDENGCTTDFADQGANTVIVRYLPWAHWTGDQTSVVGYDCDNATTPACDFGPRVAGQVPLAATGDTNLLVAVDELNDPDARVDMMMWAATFAQERIPLLQGLDIFMVNQGPESATSAVSFFAGGQLSAEFRGASYGRKFVVAHEFGHLVTALGPLPGLDPGMSADYCFNPAGPDFVPPACQHTLDSPEYQSAAMVEGFANFFAMAVWHDWTKAVATYNTNVVTGDWDFTSQQLTVDAACTASIGMPCGPGIANESDWHGTLWALMNAPGGTGPDPEAVIGLLAAADPWVVTGQTSDFWNQFTGDAANYFADPGVTLVFLGLATAWGIDR